MSQVLEMTILDLSLGLKLVEAAKASLPRAPSAAAWGRTPGVNPPGQFEVQEGLRRALQVLSEQLSTLKAAFVAQPSKVRHLARYHRAAREAHEHRAQYEFCGSWDCAEGGVSRPEAVDGAVTLFARPNPEADDVGAGGRECMPGLVLSLCEHMALQVPEKFQPRSSRQVRGRTGPPVVSMDEGEEDEDEDGDEEEDEFYSEDDDDEDYEEHKLCNAAGQVAVVVSFTGLEDWYEEGEYFIVTVQPGFDADKAIEAIEKTFFDIFALRHGVRTLPLPHLPPRPAAAAAAAAASSSQQSPPNPAAAGSSAAATCTTQPSAPAEPSTESFTVTITTGGAGSRGLYTSASSLFVVREAGGEGREVAKALLTYQNQEGMERMGPALELIEVKGAWRGQGLGRRLMQVVGDHVAAVWPSGRPDRGASLMAAYVIGSRGFFEALGFKWLDPPLCEEGLKEVFFSPSCDCGTCTLGVLSPRMRRRLAAEAKRQAEGMSAELRKLFQQGSLDTGLPLPPSHLLGPSYLPVYLPPDVCRQKLSPSFLKGYAECLEAIASALATQPQQLPTPELIMQSWPQAAAVSQVQQQWTPASQQAFLSNGGSVELSLAYVIDHCCHTSTQGWKDIPCPESDEDDEQQQAAGEGATQQQQQVLPRCSNDHNYSAVFEAVLGGIMPRQLPHCASCRIAALHAG